MVEQMPEAATLSCVLLVSVGLQKTSAYENNIKTI